MRLLDRLHRSNKHSGFLLAQFSIFGLLLCPCLLSQAPSGQITGRVIDPAGAGIDGAAVIITNTATNLQRTASTNGGGIYAAPALPPGNYSVRVEMKGFKSEVRNNIDLQVEQIADLNFTLQIGDVKETVEVSAQEATLDTENAEVGTVVETRRIEDLPLNGRNYLQLASLTPGVTQYGPGNFIAQARGGGDRSNF